MGLSSSPVSAVSIFAREFAAHGHLLFLDHVITSLRRLRFRWELGQFFGQGVTNNHAGSSAAQVGSCGQRRFHGHGQLHAKMGKVGVGHAFTSEGKEKASSAQNSAKLAKRPRKRAKTGRKGHKVCNRA